MRKFDEHDPLEGSTTARRHSLDELLRGRIDGFDKREILQDPAEKFKEFLPDEVCGENAREPDDDDRQDEPEARDRPAHEALGQRLAGSVDRVEDKPDDGDRHDEGHEHEETGGEVAPEADRHQCGILSA